MEKAARHLTDLGLTHLEVACRRCDRMGLLRVARLVAAYGNISLPALAQHIGTDCPKRTALPEHDRCSIYYPQLAPK